jgi:DNA topoisomerase VI subunit B
MRFYLILLFYTCRYIPDVARAVMETLVEIADQSPPKRPRYDKEDEELLEKVNSQEVTEMTFRDCLTQHVEQVRKTYIKK